MRKEILKFKEQKIELFYFDNPMFHEDWHEAEKLGLVYVEYDHHGPDYWDDELCFCRKDDEEIIKIWKDQKW